MSSRIALNWGLSALVAALLCWYWISLVSDSPINKDAAENLQMALNLDREGVIADDGADPLDTARGRNAPTMHREPLPAITGLAALHVIDAYLGRAERPEYFHGTRARLLKLQNVLWMAVTAIAVYVVCRQLALSFYMALGAVVLSNAPLLGSEYRNYMLDSLTTESAAAALLILASLFLMRAVSSGSTWAAVISGLCLGLLTLVKAAALYVAAGIVVALPIVVMQGRYPWRAAWLRTALLALSTVAVVLPWMIRNELSIGYFGIAGRGGEVSHNRAIMDLMTRDEMIGAIYAWAPYPFGGPLRRLLGYSRTDGQAGGRLQRLNDDSSTSFADSDAIAERAGKPEEAVSFYRKGRAEMFQLINQFKAQGNPQPYMAADAELKHRTMQIVLHHPFRHAALTLLSIWRGAWFAFPMLAIAFVWALRRQMRDVAALTLPALLLVLFYAAGSYFEPRYSMPTYPILVCLATLAARNAASRYRRVK